MKVLFISEKLDRSEFYLIKGLAEQGIAPTVLVDSRDPYARSLSEFSTRHPLKLNGFYSRAAVQDIRRHIEQSGADIVHCLHSPRSVMHGLAAARNLPVKIVAWRRSPLQMSRLNPVSRLTFLHDRLDKIICASRAVQLRMADLGVREHKLVTIYKGYDPAWYHEMPPAELRRQGIPQGTFVVACATAIRPGHGVNLLLQAAKQLPSSPPIHFIIMGECFDERPVEAAKKLHTRHQFHFLGARPDTEALLGASNLLVHVPRRGKGLSESVLTAMAQGVPTVVSDVGSMREVVQDKITGRIVRPGSVSSLARAINDFARNPSYCYKCGARALERAEERFGMQESIGKTRMVYASLVGGPETESPAAELATA